MAVVYLASEGLAIEAMAALPFLAVRAREREREREVKQMGERVMLQPVVAFGVVLWSQHQRMAAIGLSRVQPEWPVGSVLVQMAIRPIDGPSSSSSISLISY